jgi:uncharacterized protein (DUF1810 family)
VSGKSELNRPTVVAMFSHPGRTNVMGDSYDLERFIQAQVPDYERALAELNAGRKRTHWMWYVFPQMRGLGSSAMAQRFGIGSLAEARAYLEHPILGARLRECMRAILGVEARSAWEIFGTPDDLKLRSSATLFSQASAPGSVFHAVLDRFFDGQPDERTLRLLGPSQ